NRSRPDFGWLHQTMGRGVAGRRYWLTFSDCSAPAIARQAAKHRLLCFGRPCPRCLPPFGMVPAFRLAKRLGKTWSSIPTYDQRATVAHVSINASISSRLELGLLSAGNGLEFGRTQESVGVHRVTDRWSGRSYHGCQFFTGTNSLLAAHSRVRVFS